MSKWLAIAKGWTAVSCEAGNGKKAHFQQAQI